MAAFGFALPHEIPVWNSFCDQAAAVWQAVHGNSEQTEAFRVGCKRNDVLDVAPWTEVGRGQRGLPWGWSSNEAFTRNPGSPGFGYTVAKATAPTLAKVVDDAVGKGVEAVTNVIDPKSSPAPAYTAPPAKTLTQTKQIKPLTEAEVADIESRKLKAMMKQAGAIAVDTAPAAAAAAGGMGVVALGLGALGLGWFFLRPKPARALAGYRRGKRK